MDLTHKVTWCVIILIGVASLLVSAASHNRGFGVHVGSASASNSGQTTDCDQQCVINGLTFEGNSDFSLRNGCIEYNKCSCFCDGHWQCDDPVDVCNPREPKECTDCDVYGIFYTGNSAFDYRRNCDELTDCYCHCNGSWQCQTARNTCPDRPGGSRSSNVLTGSSRTATGTDGTTSSSSSSNRNEGSSGRNAGSSSSSSYSHTSSSSSSGHRTSSSSGGSGVGVITGARSRDQGENCNTNCLVNGQEILANSYFKYTNNCIEYQSCYCSCTGFWQCSAETGVTTCSYSDTQTESGRGVLTSRTDQSGCQLCDVHGTFHAPDTSFTHRNGCLEWTDCHCNCDGSWRCQSGRASWICENVCRQCDIKGQIYEANTDFVYRVEEECVEYDPCRCACDGSWNCPAENGRWICTDRCTQCDVNGRMYDGDTNFKLREDCWEWDPCICSCNGSYRCPKENAKWVCTDRCLTCDVKGNVYQGNTQFQMQDGCLQYNCDCKCDGGWNCPANRTIDTCNQDVETGCYYCNVHGERYDANAFFSHQDGCIRYEECTCRCDGSWDCPGERAVDTCRQNSTSGCYSCAVNGNSVEGFSRFQLKEDCWRYECECDCAGGWQCSNSRLTFICGSQPQTSSGCRDCVVSGNRYAARSNFNLKWGCIDYNCHCGCDGRWECPADSASVSCGGGSTEPFHIESVTNIPASWCKECVINGHTYPGNTQFEYREQCVNHHVRCYCDGGYRRSTSVDNQCLTTSRTQSSTNSAVAANQRDRCRQCIMNGQTHSSQSQFSINVGCTTYRCRCTCSGLAECSAGGNLACGTAIIAAGSLSSITSTNSSSNGQGSSTVVSGRGSTVVSGRGTNVVSGRGSTVVSGRGTNVVSGRGTTVVSGRGTTVVSGRGTNVVSGRDTAVVSGRGTSVVSGRGTTVTSGRGTTVVSGNTGQTCNECIVNNQRHAARSQFDYVRGCIRYRCTCSCGGEATCKPSGFENCQTLNAGIGCRKCAVEGRRYRALSQFKFKKDCNTLSCLCECSGRAVCIPTPVLNCNPQTVVDTSTSRCRECRVDGQIYQPNSIFTTQRDCLRYTCQCACDGQHGCTTPVNVCSTPVVQPPEVCRECVVAGRTYTTNQPLVLQQGCWQQQCTCGCNGQPDCDRNSAQYTCENEATDTTDCRSCRVNGVDYPSNSKFTKTEGCMAFQCHCFCDGTVYCVGRGRNVCTGQTAGTGTGTIVNVGQGGTTIEVGTDGSGGTIRTTGGSSSSTRTIITSVETTNSRDRRPTHIRTSTTTSESREEAARRERVDAIRRENGEALSQEREEANRWDRVEAERRQREEAARREREESAVRYREEIVRREREETERQERKAAERRERHEREREETERRLKEEYKLRERTIFQRREREEAGRREREDAALLQREREEAARQEREEAARQEREEAARQEREEAARQESEEAARQEREEAARQEREETGKEAARQEREEAARQERKEAARQERKEAARQEREEAARRESEEASRREREDAARREREETSRREREEAARREREETGRREREEAAILAETARREEENRIRERERQRERERSSNEETNCQTCTVEGNRYNLNDIFFVDRRCNRYRCTCYCNGRYACMTSAPTNICNEEGRVVDTSRTSTRTETTIRTTTPRDTTRTDSDTRRTVTDDSNTRQTSGRSRNSTNRTGTSNTGDTRRTSNAGTQSVTRIETTYFVTYETRQGSAVTRRNGEDVRAGRCVPCVINGQNYASRRSFQLDDECKRFDCRCQCDGAWTCPRQQPARLCNHTDTTASRKMVTRTTYYEYEVRTGRSEIMITQEEVDAGVCGICVIDKKPYRGQTEFNFMDGCKLFRCSCSCNGAWQCPSQIPTWGCNGTTSDSSSSRTDGNAISRTQSQASLSTSSTSTSTSSSGSIETSRSRSGSSSLSSGSRRGSGVSSGSSSATSSTSSSSTSISSSERSKLLYYEYEEREGKSESAVSDRVALTCHGCSIGGNRYGGGSDFQYADDCKGFTCTCNCDGSWHCPSQRPRILCPERCQSCTIRERTHTFNTRFVMDYDECRKFTCTCHCNGRYTCLPEDVVNVCDGGDRTSVGQVEDLTTQCRTCNVNDEERQPNTRFQYRNGCLRHVCMCNCNGEHECTSENICSEEERLREDRCRECSLNGTRYRPNSKFQHTDGCHRYNCDCACDGSYNCPSSETEYVCDGGCQECVVDNRRYRGNTDFQYDDGCFRFSCQCSCNGSYDCPADRTIDTCTEPVNENCRKCHANGESYDPNTFFQYDDGCYRYSCDCSCDGSHNCPASRTENICGGLTSGESCTRCQVNGTLHQPNSQFYKTESCSRYRCQCNCNGSWDCQFESTIPNCQNVDSDINEPVVTRCRICMVEGRRYRPNSRFQYTKGCYRYDCRCGCDGSYNCPAESTRNICEHDRNTCKDCDVRGTKYSGNSMFVLRESCLQHECYCGCDSQWNCPSDRVTDTCNGRG